MFILFWKKNALKKKVASAICGVPKIFIFLGIGASVYYVNYKEWVVKVGKKLHYQIKISWFISKVWICMSQIWFSKISKINKKAHWKKRKINDTYQTGVFLTKKNSSVKIGQVFNPMASSSHLVFLF